MPGRLPQSRPVPHGVQSPRPRLPSAVRTAAHGRGRRRAVPAPPARPDPRTGKAPHRRDRGQPHRRRTRQRAHPPAVTTITGRPAVIRDGTRSRPPPHMHPPDPLIRRSAQRDRAGKTQHVPTPRDTEPVPPLGPPFPACLARSTPGRRPPPPPTPP